MPVNTCNMLVPQCTDDMLPMDASDITATFIHVTSVQLRNMQAMGHSAHSEPHVVVIHKQHDMCLAWCGGGPGQSANREIAVSKCDGLTCCACRRRERKGKLVRLHTTRLCRRVRWHIGMPWSRLEQAERYRLQVAKLQNELDAVHANNQVRTANLLPLLNTHVSTLSFALYSPQALIAQD